MDLLSGQKEYNGQELKGLAHKRGQFRAYEFINCTFSKCAFDESAFQACVFRDCLFRQCGLNLVTLKECSFTNTRFETSQLIGINWTETTWRRNKWLKAVDFVDCALNHATFTGLNLQKIKLVKCVAHDVDFSEANLTQADCTFTDFTNSRFVHTNLTEADFTGATHYTIPANLNTLKKTKFALPEAMALLYSLDIVLVE